MSEDELRAIANELDGIGPLFFEGKGPGGRLPKVRDDAGVMAAVSTSNREDVIRFLADAPGRTRALVAEVRLLSKLLGDRLAIDSPEVHEYVEMLRKSERRRCASAARQVALANEDAVARFGPGGDPVFRALLLGRQEGALAVLEQINEGQVQ